MRLQRRKRKRSEIGGRDERLTVHLYDGIRDLDLLESHFQGTEEAAMEGEGRERDLRGKTSEAERQSEGGRRAFDI